MGYAGFNGKVGDKQHRFGQGVIDLNQTAQN